MGFLAVPTFTWQELCSSHQQNLKPCKSKQQSHSRLLPFSLNVSLYLNSQKAVLASMLTWLVLQAGVSRCCGLHAVSAARLEPDGHPAGAPAPHWAPHSAGGHASAICSSNPVLMPAWSAFMTLTIPYRTHTLQRPQTLLRQTCSVPVLFGPLPSHHAKSSQTGSVCAATCCR